MAVLGRKPQIEFGLLPRLQHILCIYLSISAFVIKLPDRIFVSQSSSDEGNVKANSSDISLQVFSSFTLLLPIKSEASSHGKTIELTGFTVVTFCASDMHVLVNDMYREECIVKDWAIYLRIH